MHDLIYAGSEISDNIKKQFPNATITDASDFIHPDRFSVDDESIEQEDWDRWVIKEGVFEVSLGIQMHLKMGCMKDEKKSRDYISRLFKEVHDIEVYKEK